MLYIESRYPGYILIHTVIYFEPFTNEILTIHNYNATGV